MTPRFAIAISACSSVMGVIIPPSILMVVWGGVMQVSVGALFLAGAIPGLLIGFALMATVYGYAKVYDYPITMKPTFAQFWSAFKGAFLAMLTPVLVIGGIVGGIVTPTESAIIAAGYALILGVFVYRTVTFRDLAGIFLLFGLFIDAIPTIIILGTVLLPVANAAGIHPVVFAIIGVISLAFGLVTPPYGLCLLISAAIGGMNVISVLKDVCIILAPMLLILLLVILFPDLALWLPRLIMPNSFQ